MNLREEYVGNPFCERAKGASRAGVVLDAIEGESGVMGAAKTGVDGWQAYNLMRCVGKTPDDVYRFYASLIVAVVVGVILLFVSLPPRWFRRCKVCARYDERATYRRKRAAQKACVEWRDGTEEECRRNAMLIKAVLGVLLMGSVVWIVHTLYIFRLKARVFQGAGLVGTTILRSVL